MTNFNDYYYQLDVPILDLGLRKGYTQYIDFITWNEVKHSVMKGIDCCQRKFIVMKFKIDNQELMQTFFQRYTGGIGWMGCGHATPNFIDTSGCLKQEQIDFLLEILNGNKKIITEDMRPCCEIFIGKEVELLNLEKIRAAIKIQRAWIKCRYNPRFQMCHRVQNRNLDIICNEN
jgi:hypothetical protein